MLSSPSTEVDLVKLCQSSQVGKLLPEALYVHTSALAHLHPTLQELEHLARQVSPEGKTATIVKFKFHPPQIAYLFYPDFDTDPHPALQRSLQVHLQSLKSGQRDYSTAPNPPILHRKETFITPDHPLYASFAWLTQQEARLGLLDNPRAIGLRQAWQQRLAEHRLVIHDHYLACPLLTESKPTPVKPTIQRHRAAIARVTASKPVRLAVEAGLFCPGTTYFDYGCGHGADIDYLHRLGFTSGGWDPHFRPDQPQLPADVVNIGYVINVIEDTAERRQALLKAWSLTQKVLIVAAQVLIDDQQHGVIAYGDGIITRRHTFQKYFQQEELKAYIDQVLGVDAIPLALGIYVVFRDQNQAETFRSLRFRSRATAPPIRLKVNQFEQHRARLQPLMDFYTERGRLPAPPEMEEEPWADLQSQFGSLKRAFQIILQATTPEAWADIADKRRQDLLVYLALSQFGQRPTFKHLSPSLQADVKALLGSYQQACTAADLMLISLGQPALLADR